MGFHIRTIFVGNNHRFLGRQGGNDIQVQRSESMVHPMRIHRKSPGIQRELLMLVSYELSHQLACRPYLNFYQYYVPHFIFPSIRFNPLSPNTFECSYVSLPEFSFPRNRLIQTDHVHMVLEGSLSSHLTPFESCFLRRLKKPINFHLRRSLCRSPFPLGNSPMS